MRPPTTLITLASTTCFLFSLVEVVFGRWDRAAFLVLLSLHLDFQLFVRQQEGKP